MLTAFALLLFGVLINGTFLTFLKLQFAELFNLRLILVLPLGLQMNPKTIHLISAGLSYSAVSSTGLH